ncbi:hypothetical protein Tco_1199489, partial [Tanacetum coccineum]
YDCILPGYDDPLTMLCCRGKWKDGRVREFLASATSTTVDTDTMELGHLAFTVYGIVAAAIFFMCDYKATSGNWASTSDFVNESSVDMGLLKDFLKLMHDFAEAFDLDLSY